MTREKFQRAMLPEPFVEVMTIGMLVYLVWKMFDFVHRSTNITALAKLHSEFWRSFLVAIAASNRSRQFESKKDLENLA